MMHVDRIVPTLRLNSRIYLTAEDSSSDNLFTSYGENSTLAVGSEFIFLQTLIDCLLRMKSSEQEKNELMAYFRALSGSARIDPKDLEEFENGYTSGHAIWWYTKSYFFYMNINAALRKQDKKMMFLWRSYLLDLYQQLHKHQLKGKIKVYRGQKISKTELNTLKESIGHLISVNSFFSTSEHSDVAKIFSGSEKPNNSTESVLFEIEADHLMVKTKPFANIRELSNFDGEDEVLFMFGSIFRVKNVFKEETELKFIIWIIEMSLCDDDDKELEEVLEYMQRQNGKGETNLRILGSLMWRMGESDLAEAYLGRYLDELLPDDKMRISIYKDISTIKSQKRDHDGAIEWQKKALELEKPKTESFGKNKNRAN